MQSEPTSIESMFEALGNDPSDKKCALPQGEPTLAVAVLSTSQLLGSSAVVTPVNPSAIIVHAVVARLLLLAVVIMPLAIESLVVSGPSVVITTIGLRRYFQTAHARYSHVLARVPTSACCLG